MSALIQTEVFTFDELTTDDAKERARDWFREGIESDELADYNDWETIAEILGVTFRTHPVKLYGGGVRYEPVIHWSGFSSQGDGASWEGSYSYAKQAPRRIRDHAPLDATLHRIADDLAAVQRRFGYRLSAKVTQSGYYSHSGTMSVETEYDGNPDRDLGSAPDDIRHALRAFADWIYRQLESQWEYLHAAEQVDESLLCNGYTFTADGRRFG